MRTWDIGLHFMGCSDKKCCLRGTFDTAARIFCDYLIYMFPSPMTEAFWESCCLSPKAFRACRGATLNQLCKSENIAMIRKCYVHDGRSSSSSHC